MNKKEYTIHHSPRIFEQVSQQIINYIRENNMKEGDRLPSERKLSDLLQVSRSSIREALKVLELSSFLRSRQGEGTFVKHPDAYLTPNQILGIANDNADLQRNFSILLICSQDLITASIIRNEKNTSSIPEYLDEMDEPFWHVFCQWINHISSAKADKYCFELWNQAYQFLNQKNCFTSPPKHITMTLLIDAYKNQDLFMILKWFHELRLSISISD